MNMSLFASRRVEVDGCDGRILRLKRSYPHLSDSVTRHVIKRNGGGDG
jgi:hypothetical protein